MLRFFSHHHGARLIGRPVGYEPISIDAYRQRLESAGVMPPFLIQHLCACLLYTSDAADE